ncbi:hypothetical protein PEX2_026420 [Penicillium expansum]|uniref:Fungal-type protein kinase domain-containing protein n=1 Tax=Penicillium expansum TaxID=27334 RepID=A0A0A2J4R5_PENEN|nr:hypothetical protein PEX2_026420 [Penicillium expansum]KGO50319.1 hypothetical protein PEX2_026420 [Penicillium expansum]
MLTVSSLDLEKVQLILKLKHVVNDNELEAVPPVPIPSQPGEIPRTYTFILLLLARDVVLSRLPDAVQFLSIKTETTWRYGPVSWDRKKRTLVGKPDYGIWYGDRKNLALNTVVVEAKSGEMQMSLAQTLACMAFVHKRRQKLKNKDSTIYGLVSDDQVFWFLKISHDSNWSERVIIARHQDHEKVLGMLVYFFQKAAAMSPHSKESEHIHVQEGHVQEEPEIVEIQDSWDMCSID